MTGTEFLEMEAKRLCIKYGVFSIEEVLDIQKQTLDKDATNANKSLKIPH